MIRHILPNLLRDLTGKRSGDDRSDDNADDSSTPRVPVAVVESLLAAPDALTPAQPEELVAQARRVQREWQIRLRNLGYFMADDGVFFGSTILDTVCSTLFSAAP
ncbi:hypothetical protein [Rhodococcus sp. JVH1]|uniref:hypothetical protein n=1 Tax=Rhodococcus sp. JVH1 TaxID=745408 RepID=UPI0005C1FEE4